MHVDRHSLDPHRWLKVNCALAGATANPASMRSIDTLPRRWNMVFMDAVLSKFRARRMTSEGWFRPETADDEQLQTTATRRGLQGRKVKFVVPGAKGTNGSQKDTGLRQPGTRR